MLRVEKTEATTSPELSVPGPMSTATGKSESMDFP
ncbi:hypothetical protein SMJ63A_60242 [Stenotrophomonas geniculata]